MKFPVLYAAIAGILWGTTGYFVRNASSLSSLEISWFRSFLGIIFLASFLVLTRKRIKIKNKRLLILTGLSLAIWVPLIVLAINMGAKLGNVTFLLDSAYAFSIPFSLIILHESINRKSAFVLLIAMIGIIFILKPFSLFQNFAEIMALGAGVLYGFNLTLARKAMMTHDTITTIFFLSLVPAIFLFPFSLSEFKIPTVNEMLNLISLSLVAFLIPAFLFTSSLKFLKTFEAGIPALLEAVTASLLGFLVYGEILDIFSIIGGVLIVGGIIYMNSKGI